MPAARYVGESVRRVEDDRVLTGRGRYIDDLAPPGTVHAVFVRSPFAHARVLSIDVQWALRLPGVIDVIAGNEVAAATSPMSIHSMLQNYVPPVFHPLATDLVRHVGDPVALVVAESRRVAEDARDAVLVEYEPLEPVMSAEDAQDSSQPPLFENVGSNIAYTDVLTAGDPDAAFARADRIVRIEVVTPRVLHAPMETRGGLAEYEPGTGELLYHATTQGPSGLRLALATTLQHPADRLHVVTPDVGGAFGQKASVAREDVAVCFAARKLRRPVKWVEDRAENLTAATQGRGETLELEAAVTNDGEILGLKGKVVLDEGAYANGFPAALLGRAMGVYLPGPYRIEHVRWESVSITTNRATWGPYRGPWAGESLARETLVDRIAAELGLDPVEIRRKNLVTMEEQPRKLATGPTMEGVSAHRSIDVAADAIGYAGFREEQRQAREGGGRRLLGIGFATYIEAAPGPPDFAAAVGFPPIPERAVAQIEPDGRLTLYTTQAPHGQSHETTLAQVAATEFGMAIENVRVVHGDTRRVPYAMLGTGASRAATMATGAAMWSVRSVRSKLLDFAAGMMEIAADDLDLVDGMVAPKDAPSRGMPVAQIAAMTYLMPPEGEEPGLRTSALFTGIPTGGFSGGTHAALVEIDAETGVTRVLRYVVAEDCGKLINPAIVDGQIRGGIAQGVGIALLEEAAYGEDGNPLASNFMDYLLPTAMEIPTIEIHHLEGDLHEVDFRGVGEGGTIAAVPAVVNAVADAIGIPIARLPMTPSRILELLTTATPRTT